MDITQAVQRYHPEWKPPADNGRTWIKTQCPFHPDENASAAVSFTYDAYKCLGCGISGNAVNLIKTMEGVTYREAVGLAEAVSPRSNNEVSPEPARKPSSKLPRDPWSVRGERQSSQVPARVRGRADPWT